MEKRLPRSGEAVPALFMAGQVAASQIASSSALCRQL
jgi:hypothetical protein